MEVLMARMARIMADAEAANADVRQGLNKLTVAQAREVARACREAEGWLLGIRRLLEVEA